MSGKGGKGAYYKNKYGGGGGGGGGGGKGKGTSGGKGSGKGAYYKAKYGGGRGGGGRGGGGGTSSNFSSGGGGGSHDGSSSLSTFPERTIEDLGATLQRIDGKGYGAYKDCLGGFTSSHGYTLFVDHVQGGSVICSSLCRASHTSAISYPAAPRRTSLLHLAELSVCAQLPPSGRKKIVFTTIQCGMRSAPTPFL
jgi:hypothetical protein